MKTEHYFCDVCKKEKEQKELSKISIGIGNCFSYGRFETFKQFDLCRECCEKVGAVKKLDENGKQIAQTLEDRLYDVIYEVVQTAMENQ